MTEFAGTYYDGQSSRGLPVQVVVEPGGLALHFAAPEEEPDIPPVFWPALQIRPHAYRERDKTVLQFGEFPFQSLEVHSPTFADIIKQAYPTAVFHKNALPAPKGGMPVLLLLGVAFLGLMVACYVYLLPAIADLIAQKIPQAAEERMGQQFYKQFVSEDEVDSARTVLANQFLRQLEVDTTYPLHVTVVESETVNAFALPGGHMVVYSGLLDKLQSPEEFAALLGHEAAHIQERHSMRSLARNLSHYLFLSIVFNDISGISAVVLENADKLKSLEYSRNLEQEADKLGFSLLKANKLDPAGMQHLFQRLQSEDKDTGSLPSLLSTHPLTDERIQHLKELMKQQPYATAPAPDLEKLWEKLEKN
ncbi:M48 family metallopeptidase [Rufibacter psychrotolerans]|uniref:M48 family metallopeptidase n=1 Tax=Rufibacter psychrotolerans TaxID=2812556 RepID=UPI0019670E9B|nr:M48 family metallopeptidase [Rufibacter sp. SYSU D00308]